MSISTLPQESDGSGRKPFAAIVFGGRSSEHAVSCSTATSVLRAIDRSRFDVVPIGIARDGRWLLMADDSEPLQLSASCTPSIEGDTTALTSADPDSREVIVFPPNEVSRTLTVVDVVFPLLHGPFGEDGTLQGLLDLGDVRYVGSGVAASAIMMDKTLMKVVFAAAGLPVGRHVVITDKEWRRDKAACLHPIASLGLPVFVKPARAGSSVGVIKVDTFEAVEAAIDKARQSDLKVLVEVASPGREVECGVLEGRGADAPRASEIGEIAITGNKHTFYDFEAKYLDSSAQLTCPANLPSDISAEIKQLSVKAFEVAGCEGLARVDWFYESGGRLVLNEINTMPGFTPSSMFPRMWSVTGLDYTELITELIELALEHCVSLR